MSNTNPDRIGEFAEFYYLVADTDLSQTDAALLGLLWTNLCLVSFDVENTFEEHVFNDQCNPDVEAIAPGRRSVSITMELNQLRHNLATIKTFYGLIDDRTIVSILALTSDKDDTDTFGFIGNMMFTNAGVSVPQSGPITESFTLRPAARSTSTDIYRRIYGTAPGP